MYCFIMYAEKINHDNARMDERKEMKIHCHKSYFYNMEGYITEGTL